jgi:glyoxalase family protein
LHAVRIWEAEREPTEALLTEVLGLDEVGEEDGWHRYGIDGGRSGTLAEVKIVDDASGRGWRGSGTGSVHHAAWRMRDTDEQQALRDFIRKVGLRPTTPIDRFWFTSVYFREEPGGVLFELATDGPGFTVDEDRANLGTSLVLPPFLEDDREQIEAALPPLDTPEPQV